MKFPNVNSCITWNHSSLSLVFPHCPDKHWSRKWKKGQDFHFSYISVWKVFCSLTWNCWLLPFIMPFSSVGGEVNRTEMEWGEVCQCEITCWGINLIWGKSSFFPAKLTYFFFLFSFCCSIKLFIFHPMGFVFCFLIHLLIPLGLGKGWVSSIWF